MMTGHDAIDVVATWAINGGAGWLVILDRQTQAGLRYTDQQMADLRILSAVLSNIIRSQSGQPVLALPGGGSGPTARHFGV